MKFNFAFSYNTLRLHYKNLSVDVCVTLSMAIHTNIRCFLSIIDSHSLANHAQFIALLALEKKTYSETSQPILTFFCSFNVIGNDIDMLRHNA